MLTFSLETAILVVTAVLALPSVAAVIKSFIE